MTVETAKQKLDEAIEQREECKRERNNAETVEKRQELQRKVSAATMQRDIAYLEFEKASKAEQKTKVITDGE